MLAWTEGTGWAQGGEVAWQTFESNGQPAGARGRATELPAWSYAAAFVAPDDRFVILF